MADQPRDIVRLIRPPRRYAILNLSELWEFRDLLGAFALRDLKLRYRQTALGVLWVVLQPLVGAGILSFVFGRVAKLESDGVPYVAFSFAGLMAWTVFSSTLVRASGSLIAGQAMVSKVFFPRLLLPLSVLGGTIVDFATSFAMMLVIIRLYGLPISTRMLAVPLWLVLLLAMASGVGFATSAVAVRYRDVQHAIPVMTQFLLYASPVAYSLSAVPHSARRIFELNPLVGLLEGFRWSVFGTPLPPTHVLLLSAVASALALMVGALTFSSTERSFADVI